MSYKVERFADVLLRSTAWAAGASRTMAAHHAGVWNFATQLAKTGELSPIALGLARNFRWNTLADSKDHKAQATLLRKLEQVILRAGPTNPGPELLLAAAASCESMQWEEAALPTLAKEVWIMAQSFLLARGERQPILSDEEQESKDVQEPPAEIGGTPTAAEAPTSVSTEPAAVVEE